MEFIDYSYSSFPALQGIGGWPAMENFLYPTPSEKASIADPSIWPNAFLAVDAALSLDAPLINTLTTGSELKSISPPLYDHAQFAQVKPFSIPSSFSFDASSSASTPAFDFNLSLVPDGSNSGDGFQDAVTLASSPLSPRAQPPSERRPTPPDPQRPKRGRPRLDQHNNKRVPQNHVERKYREGMNASLERLRKLIPALSEDNKLNGLVEPPRSSKAMILEGAIERIKELEKERDLHRVERMRLRRIWEGTGGRRAAGVVGHGTCRPRV